MGCAARLYGKKKAELDAALAEARRDGGSSHPLLADTWRAQRINTMLGFGAIHPWEISQLDEVWLNTLDGVAALHKDQAELNKAKAEFEASLAQARADNPSYRPYLRK